MKWIVGGILAAIVGFVVYLTTYLGVYKTVQLSDGTAETMTLLGKEHVGPYHKIVPVIQEVEAWAKKNNIDCTRSFGLYLDDAENVEESRLKSFGGCVIDGATLPPHPEDFSVRMFSAPHFVKALFEGSPGIGPFKVYPKAAAYIQAKGFESLPSVLEIYIVHSEKAMTTTYYFPVNTSASVPPPILATPPPGAATDSKTAAPPASSGVGP
jgi:effector-binding domain-containing protein